MITLFNIVSCRQREHIDAYPHYIHSVDINDRKQDSSKYFLLSNDEGWQVQYKRASELDSIEFDVINRRLKHFCHHIGDTFSISSNDWVGFKDRHVRAAGREIDYDVSVMNADAIHWTEYYAYHW